ncbi:DNMT3A, partial [Symbiodinium necroappetens]
AVVRVSSRTAPDFVMLSFFDGLGTAFLVCDNYCKEHNLQWSGASWEIDRDLESLVAEHFPQVTPRGDFEQEDAATLQKLVDELDPAGRARIVIAGGPPCHDFSRIRQDAPGHAGQEGSKFTRFAQLIQSAEKSWGRSRAILLAVENVIPQNRADMRKVERMLDAPAVVHDASDFGTISRPRVWWCRVPWQEIAHRKDCPFNLRWTTMQGIPRVHFDVDKNTLDQRGRQRTGTAGAATTTTATVPTTRSTGSLGNKATGNTVTIVITADGFILPRCLTEEAKPVPCLTTPSDDPQGRPAPRSSKGKISSEATQRWLADKRRYAPWHYESGVMMMDRDQRLVLPPANVKEQWHHLPKGWSASLPDHARHKAIANGWHAGAARVMFIMAVFAATPPTPAAELNPLGGTPLDVTAALWLCDYDEFDLSYLEDPDEHWRQSRVMPHPDARDASIEPGLRQWLQVWSRMRPHLTELRDAVAQQIEDLVDDLQEETEAWYSSLAPHVQKAYRRETRTCSLQLPALEKVCNLFGWQDRAIFKELTHGFRLLGPLAPGLGWKTRNDFRYADPMPLDEFLQKNELYVQDKLRRCRVDPCWEAMAQEIAGDVTKGRMEGPFSSPESWPKQAVPLTAFSHTSKLAQGPKAHKPTCFAFAVHQVGSDGKPKVRRAEDWRRSFANATVGAKDSPTYHDISAYVQLAVAVKQKHSNAQLLIWGLDHEAAYRQLAAEDPDHTWVILPTPHGITLWRHTVLMFGSVASVWAYCRIADLMSWLCRACLLTPALHFVDDFGSCEDAELVIQGVEISVYDDFVRVSGTASRRQRLDEDLVGILTANRTLYFAPQPRSVVYADAFFNLFDKDWKPGDEDIPNWGRTPPETLRNGWGFVVTIQGRTVYANGTVLPLIALQHDLDKQIIMFVHNEPARHALSKGFGKDDSINCLLQHTWRHIESLSLRPAWQRVTSAANVSDDVSRGDLRQAQAAGWTRLEHDWDAVFEGLLMGSERFRATGVL